MANKLEKAGWEGGDRMSSQGVRVKRGIRVTNGVGNGAGGGKVEVSVERLPTPMAAKTIAKFSAL